MYFVFCIFVFLYFVLCHQPLDDAATGGGETMILRSWWRQGLTDYPGNGRGGGVMVSRGQIHTRTATFVKFRSCAPCRNTLSTTEIQWSLCAQTLALLLGSTCRVQLELEPFAERGGLLVEMLLRLLFLLHTYMISQGLSNYFFFTKRGQIEEMIPRFSVSHKISHF